MPKSNLVGICRVCGKKKPLTREHIIPRAAGNNTNFNVYNGQDLLVNRKTPEKIKKEIRQGGFTVTTLCKQCNEKSGGWYDHAFSKFFLAIEQLVSNQIKTPLGMDPKDWLNGKEVSFDVIGKEVKPLNIAKRVLVALCSAEYEDMTEDRYPEIRKAILKKDYQPDTSKFSIYLGLNLSGRMLAFPLQGVLSQVDGRSVTESYAGVESEVLSMYLASKDMHLKGGKLSQSLDITSWLTEYSYDEVSDLHLKLTFNKSLAAPLEIPKNIRQL